MGKGKDVYEERRALEAENRLIQERRFHAQMKREEQADIVTDLIVGSLTAFLRGEARLMVHHEPDRGVSWITFERAALSPDGA